jgi:hypothetical protein
MATYPQKLEDAIVAAHEAGDTEAAQMLADELKQWQPKRAEPVTDDSVMGSLKQLGKGALSGAADIGNTLINASTFIPRKLGDIAMPSDMSSLITGEKPLSPFSQWNQNRESGLQSFNADNDGTAFNVGRVGGNIAGTAGVGGVGGMALKGLSNTPKALALAQAIESGGMGGGTMLNKILGGSASGALGSLLIDPSSTGYGAAVGAAFPVVGGAIGAVAQGGKALIEPLTKSGQEKIAGRTLLKYGGKDVAKANPAQFIPGSVPTTAEAVGNEGISSLTQGMRNQSPDFANALAERSAANRAARVAAVKSVAGDDVAMQSAITARESASSPLYDIAKNAKVQADSSLKMILTKPSMESAWRRAQNLAAENNESLVVGKNAPSKTVYVGGKESAVAGHHGSKTVQSPGLLDANGNPITMEVPEEFAQYSGRGLHYLKLALDDMIDDSSSGIGKNEKRALLKTKDQLLNWMDNKIPEYGIARKTYADMSRPINQMEIGQMLYDRLQSGLSQMGANTRENAATYANALRDADALAEKVTGIKGMKAAKIMTQDQMSKLQGVGFDLGRKAKSEDLARGLGSNTAKNLATQNVISRMFSPLGVPQTFSDSAMMQTAFKPLNMIYGNVAEPRIMDALGRGLLDAEEANRLLALLQKEAKPSLTGKYAPLTAGAIGGLLGRD